jgi:carboxymethylenebutenolidase
MRRLLGFLATLGVLTMAVSSAFGEVKMTTVTLKSGDEEIKAFLAEPSGEGTHPGIVVIQEWWGLTDWIKDNAKRLAEQGYVALAPDLYRGKVASDPNKARELLTGLPRDRALRDLKAAADALADRKNVDKNRLGSIGWCMGGGYSLQLALSDERIKACAICYGGVVTDLEKLKPLQATILGIFGEEDRGIPPEMVNKFEQALKNADKKVYRIEEFKAGHGFMRPNSDALKNPAYREEEANKAWKQVDAFFAKTLKEK